MEILDNNSRSRAEIRPHLGGGAVGRKGSGSENHCKISIAALNHTEMENGYKENADQQARGNGLGLSISTASLPSPITTYPAPKPPYSSTSAATPSNHGSFDYISPPSSRRTTVDEMAHPPRQSLPSLSEALRGDGDMPFSPTSVTHPLSGISRKAEHVPLPQGQSLPEPPSGPSNPFSQSTLGLSSHGDRYVPRPAKLQDALLSQDGSKSSFISINPPGPVPAPVYSSTSHSPKSSAYPHTSPSYQQSPHTKDFGPPSNVSPGARPHQQSPYTYPTDPAKPTPTVAPVNTPGSDYARFNPTFKFDERRPSIPRSHPPPSLYSKSVKRHLDGFELESSLNTITEHSSHAYEFGRRWSEQVYQRQRNGHLPEACLPNLPDIDDLMRQTSEVHDALFRVREAVVLQHQIAEEQALAVKRENHSTEMGSFSGELKANGAFSTGDSKKRRGKAAPPGRCHSCNRAETPEWRRGPDGARTLCNACGLHYAKLTRKMAVNKTAAATGSNLRPKEVETPISA